MSGPETERPAATLSRLALRLADRLTVHRWPPWVERLLYATALFIFVGAFYLSFRSLPRLDIDWRWLSLVAALVPFAIVLSGLEYLTCGRILGHRVGLGESIRISVLASAANLVPLPGAALVRMQGLRNLGAKYSGAFRSTAAIGGGWVGVACLLAGLTLAISGPPWLAASLVALGAIALAMAAVLLAAVTRSPGTAIAKIATVETCFVLISAVRMYAALQGIGVDASIWQGLILTVAAALASAAGIFPGGLGLRELIAGALSTAVGLPLAAGVAGASVDRLIGLSVLALVAIALTAIPGRRSGGADLVAELREDRMRSDG